MVESERPGEGPNDQPGGSYGNLEGAGVPSLEYNQERRNAVMRRGGRGCLLNAALAVTLLAAAAVLLTSPI